MQRKYYVVPAQVDTLRATLANLNHCAVPFLRHATASMCWYYYKQ